MCYCAADSGGGHLRSQSPVYCVCCGMSYWDSLPWTDPEEFFVVCLTIQYCCGERVAGVLHQPCGWQQEGVGGWVSGWVGVVTRHVVANSVAG